MPDAPPLHPLVTDLRRGLLGRCPCCGEGPRARACARVGNGRSPGNQAGFMIQ